MKVRLITLFAAAVLTGCATTSTTARVDAAAICHPSTALVNSALWQQTAVEYRASAIQTYAAAKRMIEAALADPVWNAVVELDSVRPGLPPAIILDVDETVFNGYKYQARQVLEKTVYTDETFAEFIDEEDGPAIAGAKEFLDYAVSRGVRIFYVTNRNMAMRRATIENLLGAQLPLDPDASNLLSKGGRPEWGSDKTSRRLHVASTHRVILLVGDDFNDFVSAGGKTLAERDALLAKHGHLFGTRWFIVANPSYGSWERSVIGKNGLTPQQEYQIKLDTLDSGRPRRE